MTSGDALSEFLGYTHDCVWDAVLMGAHHLAPAGWPLTAAKLDSLVSDALTRGQTTDTQGAATLSNLTSMLDTWGILWRDLVGGYRAPGSAAAIAATVAPALNLNHPVLVGLSNGQALPGDELGLHGHEIAILYGNPDGSFACGDGDNPQCIATGEHVTYTAAELAAAGADTFIELLGVPGVRAMWKQTATGGVDGQGHTCGTGCYDYLAAHGLTPYDGLMREEFYDTVRAFLPLNNGVCLRVRHNSDGSWLIDENAAVVANDLWNMLQAARSAGAPVSAATALQIASEAAVRAFINAAQVAARGG